MSFTFSLSSIFGKSKIKTSTPLAGYCQCSQTKPKRFYVYAHFDNGKPFYIGKGTKRRAWGKARNYYWEFYVTHMISEPHEVKILLDDMDSEQAEIHEDRIMRMFPDQLVNIVDMGRSFDSKKLDEFHRWNKNNKAIYEEAYKLEKTDPEAALRMYTDRYEYIISDDKSFYDCGLMGKVQEQMEIVLGKKGPINYLDRITMCLKKINQIDRAKAIVVRYFSLFKRDLESSKSKAILKRAGINQLDTE